MKHIYFLFILLLFFSCRTDSNNYENESSSSFSEDYDQSYNEDENYNGTYCAEVEYYNPNTGSRSTYELDVVVEDGYLVQINWPNGGWLDETHFSSEDISSGECSFRSDRGYRYTVTLGEKGGGCYNEGYRLRNRVNEDTENTTCPICGDEKSEYDDHCSSCQRRLEEEEEERTRQEEEETNYEY
ncbi:acetyl-CoA carboxylase [Empedobacter falsenii]